MREASPKRVKKEGANANRCTARTLYYTRRLDCPWWSAGVSLHPKHFAVYSRCRVYLSRSVRRTVAAFRRVQPPALQLPPIIDSPRLRRGMGVIVSEPDLSAEAGPACMVGCLAVCLLLLLRMHRARIMRQRRATWLQATWRARDVRLPE
eukprot:scaffold71079_cov63-Phaeocystis_antarctica.AAC.1